MLSYFSCNYDAFIVMFIHFRSKDRSNFGTRP
jgi:hypothetical protein